MTRRQEFGEFINGAPVHCEWQSQHSWGYFWKVDEWIYYADPINPMTYVAPNGDQVQPDKHFKTDFGSIPPPMMAMPSLSRTRFIHSYLLHDSGCRHHGLWFKRPNETLFTFRGVTREECDLLLFNCIGAEGGNAFQRSMIYRGVRIGSVLGG
jgi:hypothetical protein